MERDKFTPGFYIPYWIAEREDLLPSAKLLYGVLTAFRSFEEEGVWASRKLLGNRIGCKPQRITELLKVLNEADLIFFNGEKILENGGKVRLIKKKPPKSIDLADQVYRLRGAKSIDLVSNKESISSMNNNVHGFEMYSTNKKIRPSYIRFALHIQKKQIENHPTKFKQYTPDQLNNQIKNGAEVLDQLVRLDKWDFCDEIKPAIEWGIQDDFWSLQIRSLAALRNKGSNGETKFTNIFDGWERSKNKKPEKKKFEDPRNPSRKVLRRGPDGFMHGVWEN